MGGEVRVKRQKETAVKKKKENTKAAVHSVEHIQLKNLRGEEYVTHSTRERCNTHNKKTEERRFPSWYSEHPNESAKKENKKGGKTGRNSTWQ